jgi:cobyrinic acid a,c-diamide synthase
LKSAAIIIAAPVAPTVCSASLGCTICVAAKLQLPILLVLRTNVDANTRRGKVATLEPRGFRKLAKCVGIVGVLWGGVENGECG